MGRFFIWTRPPLGEHGQVSHARQSHLSENVYKIVLKKSIPAQTRQLILHISQSEGQVDGFVGI